MSADVLIGADGIWSSVRSTMHDNSLRGDDWGATYSGYTVYAGELNYVAPDHGEVNAVLVCNYFIISLPFYLRSPLICDSLSVHYVLFPFQ